MSEEADHLKKVSVVEAGGSLLLYQAAYDSIRAGGPGLSDATCSAIARSIAMKMRATPLAASPQPVVGDREAVARLLKRWCEGGLLQDYASVADAILASLASRPEGDQELSALQAASQPSVPGGDGDGAGVVDPLTDRLTKVAYATEFIDVREDILALIERDRTRWLDNIAVCELLAKARAERDAFGAPDRPRR